MEIRALSLRVTEDELNDWIGRLLEGSDKVERLRVRVGTEGLVADGQAEFMGYDVPFDATIELQADGGFVVLRLARFEAAGFFPLPGWFILKKLEKHQSEWLRVDSDCVFLNVEALLETRGISLATNLSGVRCEPGALSLDAQAPEPIAEAVEEMEAPARS
jgi:hypothetical protein